MNLGQDSSSFIIHDKSELLLLQFYIVVRLRAKTWTISPLKSVLLAVIHFMSEIEDVREMSGAVLPLPLYAFMTNSHSS